MKKYICALTGALTLFSTGMLFADGEAAPAPVARGNDWMQTVIMIALALVFFYFIILRPERKRRKDLEQRRSSMKKGDRVTAMGIVGTLSQVKDDTIILSMVDGSKVEVLKAAISDVKPGSEAEKKEAAEAK